ncbi:MAG: DUF134 domain-containing protein [Promethearchaeota archaeon]
MGRRRHRRWVSQPPSNLYFSNEAPPTEDSIILTIAEFEAMRLKHYVGLNQKVAAEKMGVSQPTFSRILESAHRKNTLALIEGKMIKIYGGDVDYRISFVGYGCLDCNYEWEDPNASKDRKVNCVNCNSTRVFYLVKEHI